MTISLKQLTRLIVSEKDFDISQYNDVVTKEYNKLLDSAEPFYKDWLVKVRVSIP